MVYKDLQRNFLLILWRKVVAFEPQVRIEPATMQLGNVQLGMSNQEDPILQPQELKASIMFRRIRTVHALYLTRKSLPLDV